MNQQSKQATEQQHDGVTCPTCIAIEEAFSPSAPPDRQAASLGALDAYGLAGLHTAVVHVVNCDMYDLSDNGQGVVDAERLAQDIIAEVVRRATPATRQPAEMAGRVK